MTAEDKEAAWKWWYQVPKDHLASVKQRLQAEGHFPLEEKCFPQTRILTAGSLRGGAMIAETSWRAALQREGEVKREGTGREEREEEESREHHRESSSELLPSTVQLRFTDRHKVSLYTLFNKFPGKKTVI